MKEDEQSAQVSGASIPVNKGYTRYDDDKVVAET
jgi:hypothetical protein